MYRNSSLIIEQRFNVIAEVQRYGPGQSTGDDDVASLDVPTLQRKLADQPDDTGRWMTRRRSPRRRTAFRTVVQ